MYKILAGSGAILAASQNFWRDVDVFWRAVFASTQHLLPGLSGKIGKYWKLGTNQRSHNPERN